MLNWKFDYIEILFLYCLEYDKAQTEWRECLLHISLFSIQFLHEENKTIVMFLQLTEYQIIELAENICNLKKSEGDWILHQDIVEEGNKLVVHFLYIYLINMLCNVI